MIKIVKEQREETMAFERVGATYKLPVTFVAIGEVICIRGKHYTPFPRPKGVRDCVGCALRDENCVKIQCSKFDRKDGISVFFKRVY